MRLKAVNGDRIFPLAHQGVLGRHKGGSLQFGQAYRLRTLRAADEQVGEWLEDPRHLWEESAVEIYSA